MPADLTIIADPKFILLAWSAGLAVVTGFVSFARVVGVGFAWLTAGSALVIGLAGALVDDAWWARAGLMLLGLGLLWARKHALAGALFTTGGVALLIEAGLLAGLLPATTAAAALGAVTGEMMLGHWYLIDPRLPRWTLRGLAIGGIAGLVLDGVVIVIAGDLPVGGGTTAYWILLAASIILMGAVLGALRYPAYSGVMAATGLSYLAVLTTLGAVFLGRALLAGIGPFVT